MNNYKIVIEYDGSNYVGWQRQDNGISIQQLLEESIEKLSNYNVSIYINSHFLKSSQFIFCCVSKI